ncbi:MAG: aldo/keto reductase [Candidatus Krumholzibacteriota bacterium]|nr:aldo/keto reductase [Candidatus Krumholzibacteriota bacterium]
MDKEKRKLSRRSFIGGGMAAVVGAGLSLPVTAGRLAAEEGGDDAPRIRDFRPLGKTGWKVSDIAFGNAMMQEPSLLEYAMDRGINYVDTARQYYDMEKVIGQIFPAKRDRLFVTTKLDPPLVTATVSVADLMTGIEESLERLNTDYIDCCLIHSIGDPNLGDAARIRNENIYTAFEKARSQGKIRFWGASSHGPKMIEEFTWMLENTNIDMIMPGMNFMTKGLEPVLAKAREKGVAVVAMKSLSAARIIDYSKYRTEGRTARQALLKWLLAQPGIDTISITMRSIEQVNEYVSASGNPELSMREREVLQGYCGLLSRDYCRPGCDGCLGACPHDVPIHDILRYRMYFHSYSREKYAMGLYAKLPAERTAVRCAGCAAPCESACTHQIAVRAKLIEAHRELSA